MSDPVTRPNQALEVSVIVPVLNARQYLEPCISSILTALDACHGELIIVDNGSTDGSYELLRERWGDQAAMIRRLPRPMIGGVRNYGAQLAQAATLSFIDSDCLVPRDYFRQALSVLESTGAAATGSLYALPDDPHWIEATWHSLHRRSSDGEVDYLPAGNFLCRRSAFETVGGFDEHIITGEDTELCQRLRQRGFRVFESRSVVAVHLGNPNSLSQFFAKHRWHGLGMFGTFRNYWFDHPVIMTVTHFFAIVVAVLVASWFRSTLAVCVALILFVIVPFAATIYRTRQNGLPQPIIRGTLLYHMYFDARLAALVMIIGARWLRLGRDDDDTPG